MKNRYLKGAHISERKVRELLKLFCDDLTATQIATITGISRITINAYLKMIRTHIAHHCKERLPMTDRSLISSTAVAHLMSSDTPVELIEQELGYKKPFYGLLIHHGNLRTEKITNVNQSELVDWLKSGGVKNPGIGTALSGFQAIADFNSLRLFRVANGTPKPASLKGPVDDIELFWSMLKSRLVKFRGLNGNTLYLHVKETEFRFNHRNHDIFEMLVNIFHHRPLHVARQYN
jgi:transposase